MGLLRWLKGDNKPAIRDPLPERARVDWAQLEDALADSIALQVSAFHKAHAEEEFYAFALDCNAHYANILFCLNTSVWLEESARSFADAGDAQSLEIEREELRWGLDDWLYHGFNLESPDWHGHVPMLGEFAELASTEDTELFLVTCCKALLRADQSGAFECLRKSPGFDVACIDHDEDPEAGRLRLERVRGCS